jgi:hypothetical protein
MKKLKNLYEKRELGYQLRATTGDPRETSWLVQRLSVAIQPGKAASLLATTTPYVKTRAEDVYGWTDDTNFC